SVGDDQVVELKNLMALLAQSNSRFVKLEDNQVLCLTEELRQRLSDVENLSEDGKFHVLASPLIDDAIQGMRQRTLHAWDKQRALLQQAEQLVPQLPTTLQAELRDYQLDGYHWATRLAHWGGGACLADDMGLGKTVQALAVILDRAPNGPSLVLAPTSVCFNWQQEVAKFAPTLRVKIFGVDTTTNEQRQNMLDQAQPFDLIICSYGLLQREGERLAKVHWHTIVADEAQALKNPMAKRTQAAFALKGDFKMITTGTPIENNLNELWSLFRFINPGLLGAQKQFHKRFANPMESTTNTDESSIIRANQALRKLISPFLLRRMKTQVLTELPSRTEINIQVEMSEPEVVLYEALRQQAIENLAKGDETPGQHHIKMLAEIMKLRRACCHPSLVVPNSGIEGSKLKAFDNLIDELRQNNHKALVFSQFVGHLKILRQHLERKGINYQYLDGSTPAKKRRDSVNAFQAGEGDVFLISLKAGGSGLNLTAADYVIHMDPWWNPAVEDQASDRAHRMGQTRPVTIYRLIAKNTIEDKILALHQRKRDLANSLLDGNDSAGAITASDMMALLQQQV
ncbi:MAG: DEAD/DEAH box helicase, partial [Gammaproteobacteria bacterium]|nr:DEAD/DEAH box helicase [Gammaproteobacteria bacterium]